VKEKEGEWEREGESVKIVKSLIPVYQLLVYPVFG